MNYIKEVLAFNEWAELNSIKPDEYRLWHALMEYNNRFNWSPWFRLPIASLRNKTTLPEKKILQLLDRLAEQGLITMQKDDEDFAVSFHINSVHEILMSSSGAAVDKPHNAADVQADIQPVIWDVEKTDSLTDKASCIDTDKSISHMSDSLSMTVLTANPTPSLSDTRSVTMSCSLSALYKPKLQTQTKPNKSVGQAPAHNEIRRPPKIKVTKQDDGKYSWVIFPDKKQESLFGNLRQTGFSHHFHRANKSVMRENHDSKNKRQSWNLTLSCGHLTDTLDCLPTIYSKRAYSHSRNTDDGSLKTSAGISTQTAKTPWQRPTCCALSNSLVYGVGSNVISSTDFLRFVIKHFPAHNKKIPLQAQ